MTIKTLIILTAVVLGYVSSTWLRFGTAHPCEILVVRQKDHAIEAAEKHHLADLESIKELGRNALPKENYVRLVQSLDEYSNASLRGENQSQLVMAGLRQKTREMTTAQCAWQAITWRASTGQFTSPQD